MRHLLSCAPLAVAALHLLAQAPGQELAFDAASVKQSRVGEETTMIVRPGGILTATNIPLHLLMRTVFGVQDDQIVGEPSWAKSDRFDFTARGNPAASIVDVLSMTRSMLRERFRLATHSESRNLPIYALLRTRTDPVVGAHWRPTACPQPDDARPPCGRISTGAGTLTMRNVSVWQFAQFLSTTVGRTVVDQTMLAGNFDVDLEWTPDRASPDAGDPTRPSIFTAVQEQLGLKLESTRGPVDVLVIDHVERPTED